jgi:hypothetical protein
MSHSNAAKLAELVAATNHHSLLAFLQSYIFKRVVPGICQNVSCSYVGDVLPAQDDGYCRNCNTRTVKSGLRLAYIA